MKRFLHVSPQGHSGKLVYSLLISVYLKSRKKKLTLAELCTISLSYRTVPGHLKIRMLTSSLLFQDHGRGKIGMHFI